MAAGLRRGGPGLGTMSFRYGPLRTLERAQERARKAEARRRAKREMSGLPPTAEEEVLDGVNQTRVAFSAVFAALVWRDEAGHSRFLRPEGTDHWLRADRYAPGDLSDLKFHPAGANSKRKLDVSKFLAAKPGDGQLRLQLDPAMVAEAERRGLHRWIPKKMEEPFAMSNCRTRLTDVDAHKRRLLEEGIPIDSPKDPKAKPKPVLVGWNLHQAGSEEGEEGLEGAHLECCVMHFAHCQRANFKRVRLPAS